MKYRSYLSLALLFFAMNLSACIPLVDLYIVGEGGYQAVSQKVKAVDDSGQTAPATTAKSDGFVYGGGLGVGLSFLRLYAGAELTFVGIDSDGSISREFTGTSDTFKTNIDDKWILNAMVDGGIYLLDDVLLFGRVGYVYTDSNVKNGVRVNSASDLEDFGNINESAFAFGGGVEYEIGLGLGVRLYYLHHQGNREANEVRSGIIWRF